MFVSGFFALLAALQHHGAAAIAGALAFGAGACEWHGASLLATGRSTGTAWMKYGELFLLAVVIAYSAWMLETFDAEAYRAQIPESYREWNENQLLEAGLTEEELPGYYRLIGISSGVIVIFVSLAYQGGLALYYHRKRRVLEAALPEIARH